MKISLFFLTIIFLNLVSAISISTPKEVYQPGETFTANFEGNFLTPINTDDVFLYSGRTRIPIIYDLLKIEDKYYFYCILLRAVGNYTLKINNVYHMQGGSDITENLEKNFTIQGNLIDFYVEPGFILAKEDFSIKVFNNIGRFSLNTEFGSLKQSVEMKAGETKKLEFSTLEFPNFTTTELKLSSSTVSYSIPVIILGKEINETLIIIEANQLRFSSIKLAEKSYINTKLEKIIALTNFGDSNLTDINLTYPDFNDILNITPMSLSLEPGESKDLILTFYSSQEGKYQGDLIASFSNISAKIYLDIEITKNITEINDSIIPQPKTCSELGGAFCVSTQICNGTSSYTSDGYCCLGNCYTPSINVNPPKPSTSAWKIILIIVIILALGGIGYFVLKKYKRKSKTSKDILIERERNFQEKFKPTEVRGNLTKI